MATYTHSNKKETNTNIPKPPYQYTEKKIEQSQIELSITVPQNIVQKTYKQVIKELNKEAQIKGFRKGHIPESVLVQKFSPYITVKCFDALVNTAYTELIPHLEFPPLHYASPQAPHFNENTTINPNESFTCILVYDRKPDVTLASLDSLSLVMHTIEISEKDIEQELASLQERNAFTIEKQGIAEEGNSIIAHYVELDENNKPQDHTYDEKYTITLGANDAMHDKQISDALIGARISEKKVIQQSFPQDYKISSLAGKSRTVEITIQRIQERKLPDIDDDLAQDINEKYKTLEDLKLGIRKQLQERSEDMQNSYKQKNIMQYLLKESTIEIPQSVVQLQINAIMQRFAQQTNSDVDSILSKLQKTKEELWQEEAIIQVKEQLVMTKAIEESGVHTSEEEVETVLREQAKKHDQNPNEVIDYYKKQNLLHQLQYEHNSRKTFERLIEQCKEETGKTLSFSEYVQLQQEEDKKDYNK